MHLRHNFDTRIVMSMVKRHYEQLAAEVESVDWYVCAQIQTLF
jgi:hypothetical protein